MVSLSATCLFITKSTHLTDGIHITLLLHSDKTYFQLFINKPHITVTCPHSRPWIPPDNWTVGDDPAYYHGFENLNCVELMNGAQHTDNGIV